MKLNQYGFQETVIGRVTDALTGESLPGVNIVVEGTTTGTTTDIDGNYSIDLDDLNTVLIFSYIGYQTQRISLSGRTEVNVQLQLQSIQGAEVVVSGYQVQSRASLSGSISVVDTEVMQNQTVSNPLQSLQGRVAGLFVNTSGDPSGRAEIRIRGVSTLNDNNPLYVIDGIPTNENAFSNLNPSDIADIQILKDAASAAIYGSRSSNGVVLVTTNRSRPNTFNVKYSSQITRSDFHTVPQVLNTRERAEVYFWAATNDGINPDEIPDVTYDYTQNPDGSYNLNGVSFPEFIAPGVRSSDTNWFDAISRTGIINEQNLTISNGGTRGGGTVSLRYFNNDYILNERSFERLTARINSHLDLDQNGRIRIGQNLNIAKSDNNGLDSPGPMFSALNVRTILPVFTDDGNWSGPPTGNYVDSENPLRQLQQNAWDRTRDISIFGNVYTNVELRENLLWNSNFGVDWLNRHMRDFSLRYQTGFLSRQTNQLVNTKSDDFTYNFNTSLNYQLDLNRHKATFLAGTELSKNTISSNTSIREDFAIETLDFMVEDAASGSQFVRGSATGFSLLSYFGKVDYALDDKYYVSFTIRHDGSSKFAPGNRFGTFPSVSAAWRLDQERFLIDNSFLSELKLRAGWGRTGNQRISNEARFGLFDVSSFSSLRPNAPWVNGFIYDTYGTSYDIQGNGSGSLPTGFRRLQLANPDLRWESTSEVNVGIDYSFRYDKVYGSIDYFDRNSTDILIQPDFIAVLGEGGDRFVNGASVNVKGFEVSASYRDQIGGVNFNITGTLGHFKDKITKLPDDVIDSYPGNREQNILGRSMNSIFGYVADGLFQSDADVANHASQPGAAPGRIKYKDLNGDGVIDALDQQYFGSTTADFEYGLNFRAGYKGFDFNMFWQGIYGRDVLETDRRRTDFTSLWAGTNYGTRILDFWRPDNTDTDIPAVTLSDNNDENRPSTFFLADGSYLKLRQITIGYTFSDIPLVNSLRIYASGDNLLTFKSSSFTGPDPERPGSSFPRPRNLSLGVNVSFN
jgi:TonB-linked SusC/RagA family outer membrane protein